MLVPILTTCLHGVLNYLTYLPYSWVCLSLFKVICCFQTENPPLDPFGESTPQQTQIGNWHVCALGGTSNQDQPSPGVNSHIVDRERCSSAKQLRGTYLERAGLYFHIKNECNGKGWIEDG